MSQLVTQAAITFQPTSLRIHEQAGEQWLVAPRVAVRARKINVDTGRSDARERQFGTRRFRREILGQPNHGDG